MGFEGFFKKKIVKETAMAATAVAALGGAAELAHQSDEAAGKSEPTPAVSTMPGAQERAAMKSTDAPAPISINLNKPQQEVGLHAPHAEIDLHAPQQSIELNAPHESIDTLERPHYEIDTPTK